MADVLIALEENDAARQAVVEELQGSLQGHSRTLGHPMRLPRSRTGEESYCLEWPEGLVRSASVWW